MRARRFLARLFFLRGEEVGRWVSRFGLIGLSQADI
jgi:hypothetical protein